MSKTLTSIIALVVLTFASSSAFATANVGCHTYNWNKNSSKCKGALVPYFERTSRLALAHEFDDRHGYYATGPKAVPELSAAAAPISIALVGGLLAFGLERRRKQSKK